MTHIREEVGRLDVNAHFRRAGENVPHLLMGEAVELPPLGNGWLAAPRGGGETRLRPEPSAQAIHDVSEVTLSIGHDPILSERPNIARPDIRDARRYGVRHSDAMFGEGDDPKPAIGPLIRDARKGIGLNQKDFGARVGVGQSVVSDWERGELDSWREYLPEIARVTQRPLSFFAPGALITGSHTVRELEVVGDVQGGTFRAAIEYPPEDRYTVPAPAVIGYEGVKLRALRVLGPSVNELYPDGTFVIVVSAADTDVRVGDKVVVYSSQGELREATIKEVRVDAEGQVVLWPRSTHPDFQSPIVLSENDQDNPEIAFVVVGSFRIEDRPPPPITIGRRRT